MTRDWTRVFGNSNRAKWVLAGVVLAVMLGGLVFGAASGGEKASTGTAATKPAVSRARAERRKWTIDLAVPGAVVPWQEMQVAARGAGVPIQQILVEVGDRVSEGQILARYDDRKVAADLRQARAQVMQAEALLAQARVERDRARGLKDIGAISERELLQAETQYRTAAAQKEAADAAAVVAQVRMDDTRIIAPGPGIVSARSAAIGQVPATGTELFRIIRGGRLEWRAELNAAQLLQIEPGMTVSITLPDGGTATGRVRQEAQALDPISRLGIAYVDLNPGSNAKSGMYVRGKIGLGDVDAIVIPAQSVLLRDGRSIVFRVQGGKALRVVVETGRREGDWIEITKGLNPGDEVVVRGAGFLTDGEPVRIVGPFSDKTRASQP